MRVLEKKLLESDLIKMKRPYIMYASSYYALYFCDDANRHNLKAKGIIVSNKNEEEDNNFHQVTSSVPK